MYIRTRRTSWRPDRQRVLGTVLSGAWYPTGRTDAVRQVCGQRRRQLQHVFQRNRRWKTRPPGRVHRPRTDRRW